MKKKSSKLKNVEIEVRFLEIDKKILLKRLNELGAKDLGEELLRESIFYDKNGNWAKEHKFARIRTDKSGSIFSYKHYMEHTVDGTLEIEFPVVDIEKMRAFLDEVGVEEFRIQEKRRHKFIFDDVVVDIDEWPNIPAYVELEGESEENLKKVAEKLGLSWKNAVFENAKIVIEERYNIPVSKYKYFTFEKME